MPYLPYLDIIKQKIQSLSVDNLLEILIYFIAGFILGLVIKHSIRYFLWFLIIGILGLWATQNLGIVSINYSYLQEVIRLVQDYTISDLLSNAIEFVHHHIGESLALVFGFYLSWEIL